MKDFFAFSAANTFPLKVLLHRQLSNMINTEGKVIPVHVQLNPSNICNFKCDFCSCSGRNKKLVLPVEDNVELMRTARNLGCQSVTITGGGEPTLHPNFTELVHKLRGLELQLGLVSNGSLLSYLPERFFDNFVWFRISAGDNLVYQLNRIGMSLDSWLYHIDNHCKDSKCDWAFSYVIGEKPNFSLIAKLVEFANSHNFSHIRIVNDILKAEHLADKMVSVKQYLNKNKVDDCLVNYQDRSGHTLGYSPCYISLLKPVIDAQGAIFPCCGTQYALANPSRDYEQSMRMGNGAEGLRSLVESQRFFDGSVCVKCYYGGYNTVLKYMLHGVKHSLFL